MSLPSAPAAALLVVLPVAGAACAPERIDLEVDVSQAEAVLAVLAKRASGEPPSDGDWQRIFASEPYQRLKEREIAMQRPFTDADFRTFVMSDELLARAEELERTLGEWRARPLEPSARAVLSYLPDEARIHATVYPVIKPSTNSFVFDTQGDPAIFLYLDPAMPAAVFENTVAHELHHIGFASVPGPADVDTLPAPVQEAVTWMGAFGEGFAMLAAAGGPDTHPHAGSAPADRERWDRDVARFDEHVGELERFFMDVIEGRLTGPAVRERAAGFYGVQGPWYTVGYTMAVAVERRFGREALIEGMADPRFLLARYNEAAGAAPEGTPRALWSEELLERIGVAGAVTNSGGTTS